MNRPWTRFLPALVRNKLSGKTVQQNIIANTGWLFADNMLRMGIGFLVGIWVTRYLGPERFGQLNYAIAFVTIFSSTALLGLDGIVIRNLVRTPSRRNEILGTTFALKLAAGAAMVAMTMAVILMLRSGDRLAVALVGITSLGLFFQSFGTIDFWFQSQVQSRYCAMVRSGAFLAISAVKVALIASHAPLIAFAWAGLAEIVLGAVGLAVAYRLSGNRFKELRASRAMAGEMLRDSWPLVFTDIVTVIYMRADKVMIGELSGDNELGIYAVAALVAETLSFIPRAVSSSLYPGIVTARGENEGLFLERMQEFYNLMAFLSYAVAVPASLLAGWLIPTVFGAAYARSGTLLAGLVWVGIFVNLGLARSCYLTAMNWTRLHFVTDLLGCIASVALNLLLIPHWGGMGAVIAAGIAYWLAVHGSCFLFGTLHRTGRMLTRAMLYPKIW